MMIFRFDVREFNDILCFRDGTSDMVVTACNDGYIRVWNITKQVMEKAIKGCSGNPLCLDIAGLGTASAYLSEQRNMMAVGYEDDSFLVYSI